MGFNSEFKGLIIMDAYIQEWLWLLQTSWILQLQELFLLSFLVVLYSFLCSVCKIEICNLCYPCPLFTQVFQQFVLCSSILPSKLLTLGFSSISKQHKHPRLFNQLTRFLFITYWVLSIIIELLCMLAGRSAVDVWWWHFWGWGVLCMVNVHSPWW